MESHDNDPFLFGCFDESILHLAKRKSRKIFQVAARPEAVIVTASP
jgi:hypothetical protein